MGGEFGPWHLLIVAGVFIVLFGAKKLPDAARSLGKSARILKTELKDLHNDDDPNAARVAELQSAPPAPVVPAAPVSTPAPVSAPAPVSVPAAAAEPATPVAQPPAQ